MSNFQLYTPESVGVKSEMLLNILKEYQDEGVEIHSMIVSRHDKVIFEGYWAPHAQEKLHRLCSAGKVIVAAATLFAIQEGLYSLDDKVIDLIPWAAPENPSEYVKQLSVYHLLTMSCGHGEDSFGTMLRNSPKRAEAFLAMPIVHKPGTEFLYDNGAPDMLAIINKEFTHQSISDYLRPRLFDPLEMGEVRVAKNGDQDELPTYCMTTRALYNFTQFFRNGGKWNGKQLLDEELVNLATSYQVPACPNTFKTPSSHGTEGQQGYGFYFWKNSVGGWRLSGGCGQLGVVVPEWDMTFVCNSNDDDHQIMAKIFFKHAKESIYGRPIDENPNAYEKVLEQMKCLTMAKPNLASPAKDFSGTYALRDTFYGVNNITFNFGETLTLTTDFERYPNNPVNVKNLEWTPCKVPFMFAEMRDPSQQRIFEGGFRLDTAVGFNNDDGFVSGRWVAENAYELRFRSDAWMGGHIVKFIFNEEETIVEHTVTLAECRLSKKYMDENSVTPYCYSYVIAHKK